MVTMIVLLQGVGAFAKDVNYKAVVDHAIHYLGERYALPTDYPSIIGFECELSEKDRSKIQEFAVKQHLLVLFNEIKSNSAKDLSFCTTFEMIPQC